MGQLSHICTASWAHFMGLNAVSNYSWNHAIGPIKCSCRLCKYLHSTVWLEPIWIFDAAVVFVTSRSLLFRLALAILCYVTKYLLGITDFFIMSILRLVFAVTFQLLATLLKKIGKSSKILFLIVLQKLI